MTQETAARAGHGFKRLVGCALAAFACAIALGAIVAASASYAAQGADSRGEGRAAATGAAPLSATATTSQDYSFEAYVIPKTTYTDQFIPIYVKTSYPGNFYLSFTDSAGKSDGLKTIDRVDADDIINDYDSEHGGYKLGNAEGRIFAHSFERTGTHTMRVRDDAGKELARFTMNIDYDYETAETAYIDQLIASQTNSSMDPFEKMDAIQSYLLSKMKYLKGFKSASGGYNGPCKLLEEYLGWCNPWWVSFIGDSSTTPSILCTIANRLGVFTDVHNCYGDYASGTDGWYSFHDKCRCTGVDKNDQTQVVYYSICPSGTSNLVDAENADQLTKIDFSEKYTSRWQKLDGGASDVPVVTDPIGIDDDRVSMSVAATSYEYTGSQIKPAVKLTFRESASSAEVELVEGVDYVVSYGENTDAAGDGFVRVDGIGKFGGDRSQFIEIEPRSVSGAVVSTISDQSYTGQAICPEPRVVVDGRVLTKGDDYTLSYTDNVKAGTATVRIVGEENYCGVKEVQFKIVSSGSSGSDVEPDPTPTPTPTPAPASDVWKRLSGNTAIGTMKAIVNEGWDTSEWAIVATTSGYYDALSASGLAGLLDCPILMTAQNKLSDATATLIKSKKVKNVVVVGGVSAVSDNTFNQIKALGVGVERVAGNTAIGTANAIYEYGKTVNGGWGSDAIVATSGAYQDALSIAPYAYAKKAPIFLAGGKPGTLSDKTLSKLRAGGFSRTIIAGGEAAVAKSVESQVPGAKRLGGNTAYGTSKLIANFCISQGMSAAHMGVATGRSYYDALSGAALCGKMNSVIVLADEGRLGNVTGVVKPHKDELQESCYIFGGTGAVSANVENAIKDASK